MLIFKCKICGGDLEISSDSSIAICQYCGTKQTLPHLSDERRANLYDRANHFRRNNDYDKAMGIYEQILSEDTTDAEAYWSIILCRYGIEYVKDGASNRYLPTINRMQYTSIYDDEDYKSAIQNADTVQREIYEADACEVNGIQKEILSISQKEEPFDVFICYKETDANGRRTQDSVLATELYHELTKEGFKVFFSRITLEDKLGTAYEPYIFAALNSAKVMVVLGTKPEHFNAVWVKNEWSRYLALIKNGAKKMLIPAYRDMDPYDLPDEFSHLQAQDMSKLGFMQDLIRGIKKILEADVPAKVAKETVIQATPSANIAPLLKRAFMFLEDGDFERADEFCEQVLNQDPECAEAYLGKLMVECNIKTIDQLKNASTDLNKSLNFNQLLRFSTADKIEFYKSINNDVFRNLEKKQYDETLQKLRKEIKAAKTIDSINTIIVQAKNLKKDDTNDLSKQCTEKINEIKESNKKTKKRIVKTFVCISCIALVVILGVVSYKHYQYKYKPQNDYGFMCEIVEGGVEIKNASKDVKIITVPERINGKNVIGIGSCAFSGCTELTSISLPENLTYIGSLAFRDCTKLTSVTLPKSIKSIGLGAFINCISLSSLSLPDSLTSIDSYAFSGCSSIKSFYIPDRITKINNGTFEECTSLSYVSIPAKMANIADNAFDNCLSLTELNYRGTSDEWHKSNMLFNMSHLFKVNCADGKYFKKYD